MGVLDLLKGDRGSGGFKSTTLKSKSIYIHRYINVHSSDQSWAGSANNSPQPSEILMRKYTSRDRCHSCHNSGVVNSWPGTSSHAMRPEGLKGGSSTPVLTTAYMMQMTHAGTKQTLRNMNNV